MTRRLRRRPGERSPGLFPCGQFLGARAKLASTQVPVSATSSSFTARFLARLPYVQVLTATLPIPLWIGAPRGVVSDPREKTGGFPAAVTKSGVSKMVRMRNRYGQVVSLVLAGLLLAACQGDDGSPGADGAPGPAGPPGPSTGDGIPVESADRITISVSSLARISA